ELVVEAEMAGAKVAGPRFDTLAEYRTDRVKRFDVGHRIAPRTAADRRLVDLFTVADPAHPQHAGVRQRRFAGLVQAALDGAVKRIVHERAFAAARDAGHQAEHTQRKRDVDVLQIVAA